MFEGSRLEPPPCAGQPLAQAVTRAFGRAQSLVDRASVAPRVRQAKTKLRKAVRLLAKASRLVRAQGNLPVDCVVALGSILEEARIRAERLARTL